MKHPVLVLWLGAILLSLSACAPLRLVVPLVAPATTPQAPPQALPVRNEIVDRVEPVASPGVFTVPWDATPDPEGEVIYFTATAETGAGVFRVAATGGDVEAVAGGAPFVSPLGLAVSRDGQTLYVADPGANAVLVVPVPSGDISVLAGTEGTAPRNLEIAAGEGADVLYISGVDPTTGQPALMRMVPAEDDEVQVVLAGAPLVQPEGVAIAGDGTLYVADRTTPGGEWGQVHRIQNGALETIARGFRVGALIGATLTPDDALLLVSALHPTAESAQVLLIELPSMQQAIFNQVIGENTGSGGVHRAHNAAVFAWADSKRNDNATEGRPAKGGSVYLISP